MILRALGPRGIAGGGLLGVILVTVALGLVGGPSDASRQDLGQRLQPPLSVDPGGRLHIFGTDHLGRDMLARTTAGARTSVLIALAALAIAGSIGVAAGVTAGFAGPRIDGLLMTLTEAQLALPFTLIALSLASLTDPSVTHVLVVLGATGWVPYARVVRSQVLSVREREFVTAARGLGSHPARIAVRHILPHCTTLIVVLSTFVVGRMIMAEATISFLGVGMPAWVPSWGTMISEGRTYLPVAWWVTLIPAGAATVTVIGLTLLGDSLGEWLEPQRRGQAVRAAGGRGRTDVALSEGARSGEAGG
jgi:peptide/nickel transport system permease protein